MHDQAAKLAISMPQNPALKLLRDLCTGKASWEDKRRFYEASAALNRESRATQAAEKFERYGDRGLRPREEGDSLPDQAG